MFPNQELSWKFIQLLQTCVKWLMALGVSLHWGSFGRGGGLIGLK